MNNIFNRDVTVPSAESGSVLSRTRFSTGLRGLVLFESLSLTIQLEFRASLEVLNIVPEIIRRGKSLSGNVRLTTDESRDGQETQEEEHSGRVHEFNPGHRISASEEPL